MSAVVVFVSSEPIAMRKVAKACHQHQQFAVGDVVFDCRSK